MCFKLTVISHHKKKPVTLLDIADSCTAVLMHFVPQDALCHLRNMIVCIGR